MTQTISTRCGRSLPATVILVCGLASSWLGVARAQAPEPQQPPQPPHGLEPPPSPVQAASDTFFGTVRADRGGAWMKTLLLLLTLTACAAATEPGVMARLPSPSRNSRVRAERLAAARYVLPGTLAHVRENWIYEPTCGLFTKLRGQLHVGDGCNGMRAYEADIVADTTLVPARKLHIIYFVMSDSAGLAPGTSAVWILHRDAVYPVLTCAQHQAITSTGCLAEMWPTLESDDDVIALSEWPEVRDALHQLGRDR